MENSVTKKSEVLFIYESNFNIPNGDPFTGEQRYDEETKKILISDVRIKRYIRDYLLLKNYEIFVTNSYNDGEDKEGSGAARRFKKLQSDKKSKEKVKPDDLLKECIDVRLFGGIVTIKNKTSSEDNTNSFNLTGPVQFALLNPSLNEVDLRIHQNTSVFSSSAEKKQGAIGTTTLVPYSINQIHGWINPYSALCTNLTVNDIQIMFKALWNSINNVNTRSKANQNSLLLFNIIYKDSDKKIYDIDKLISLDTSNKSGEQIRSLKDVKFDFSKLIKVSQEEIIEKIQYYSDIDYIINQFEKDESIKNKLEKINLDEINYEGNKV